MNKLLLTAALIALPTIAIAASGGEAHGGGHGEGGIPSAVMWQFINFALYAGLLLFVLRKPVKQYFQQREQTYKQALIKGESARKDAEAKKREIQERLTRLESSANDSIANARAEANALVSQMTQEAESLAQRLREEASRTAQIEIEKAKTELREELLGQSVALTRKILEEKMAEPDQKRLQTEFVDKIQTVP